MNRIRPQDHWQVINPATGDVLSDGPLDSFQAAFLVETLDGLYDEGVIMTEWTP